MEIASGLSTENVPRGSTLPAELCKLGYMASDLKDRAQEARIGGGFKTVPPFADAIGVEPSAIYQIESGKTRSMKAENLAAYERVTGYRADWIRTGKEPKRAVPNVTPLPAPKPTVAPSQSVQLDVLTMAIQEVEGVLEDGDLELQVSKRAAVIASTYALLEQGMPTATVVQFIRAAVA